MGGWLPPAALSRVAPRLANCICGMAVTPCWHLMLRTQVAIIGGGPAGLLLSQLLHQQGITSIVLERRPRAYVEARIRAGLLEQQCVDLLVQAGVGERLQREGLVHGGFGIAWQGRTQRIDLQALTGRCVTVYGQTEIQRDLGLARARNNGDVRYEATDLSLEALTDRQACVRFTHEGARRKLACDFIAGCDGFHGVSRLSIPVAIRRSYERVYPCAWLGVLAEVPPLSDELLYVNHARGFALCSMRSRTRSRYYLQCAPDEMVEQWPDERFWEELRARLPAAHAARLVTGPAIDKSIVPLRSVVVEPMQYGALFLAGDAAHIVPPTGAKGLNLAAADVRVLSRGLIEFYRSGRRTLLDEYSARALARVWKATRFSWWFTTLLHRLDEDSFSIRLQHTELEYLAGSAAAARALAENYAGLAFDADV
jgi:p-hydroxybenzoate 3-monooxygenase